MATTALIGHADCSSSCGRWEEFVAVLLSSVTDTGGLGHVAFADNRSQ
jgi:hypothetical protein